MGKSTLSRSETMECLNDIQEMSEREIATMDYDFIRIVASSAHNHILRLRSDLERMKRQLKPKPEPIRQSLHNTIDVMSDQQINTLATSLGLEVSHD